MPPAARAAPFSSVGCSHVGTAPRDHLGSAKQGCAGLGAAMVRRLQWKSRESTGMAESLGNAGPSGSVLCPAMEGVLVLVDPAHNKAFIPVPAWPHPAGNETVPAIRVQPNQFGSRRGCSRAAPAWSLCPPVLFGVLILVTSPGMSPSCPTLSTAGCLQRSQRGSGGFNHRH